MELSGRNSAMWDGKPELSARKLESWLDIRRCQPWCRNPRLPHESLGFFYNRQTNMISSGMHNLQRLVDKKSCFPTFKLTFFQSSNRSISCLNIKVPLNFTYVLTDNRKTRDWLNAEQLNFQLAFEAPLISDKFRSWTLTSPPHFWTLFTVFGRSFQKPKKWWNINVRTGKYKKSQKKRETSLFVIVPTVPQIALPLIL